jgi:hypothetical protein
MEAADVPRALAERLGRDATEGLLSLLATTHQEWTADVTTAAVERFERRLAEESSGLRQAMTQMNAELGQAIARVDSELRQLITRNDGELRQALAQSEASLRREIVDGDAKLLEALNQVRVDVLKWSIGLWMGQIVALAGIMALMLRVVGA